MLIEHLIVLLLIICLIYLVKIDRKIVKRKRRIAGTVIKKDVKLGDLTGKYKHLKKPGGNLCLVEFKLKDSEEFGYRVATTSDLKILNDAGYLKKQG